MNGQNEKCSFVLNLILLMKVVFRSLRYHRERRAENTAVMSPDVAGKDIEAVSLSEKMPCPLNAVGVWS
jgi:hypothetical protein